MNADKSKKNYKLIKDIVRKKLHDWPKYMCSGIIHPDEMKSSDERFPIFYDDCIKEKSENALTKQERNFFGTAKEQCFYQSVILRFNSNSRGGPYSYQISTPVPIHKKSYMISDRSNMV